MLSKAVFLFLCSRSGVQDGGGRAREQKKKADETSLEIELDSSSEIFFSRGFFFFFLAFNAKRSEATGETNKKGNF